MVVIQELSTAERRIWDAFPSGEIADFRTGEIRADDLTHARAWGRERRLRARVIAALLCGAVEDRIGVPALVYIRGAYIEGAIELQGAELKYPLVLEDCCMEGGLDLTAANARTLVLRDSLLGPLILGQATINGELDLRGSRLMALDEIALQGDELTVINDMWCGEGFYAEGEVRLVGANIGGHLDFRGAHLTGKGSLALSADRLKVAQNMFCGETATGEPFRAIGGVRLMWAQVDGQLAFRGAQLTGGESSAISAHGLAIVGDMFCDNGFHAERQIDLSFAKVGGILSFSSAELSASNGPALMGMGLSVSGEMQCEKLQGDGGVDLVEAAIRSLSFNGACLTGRDRPALNAEGLEVTLALSCSDGFVAHGEIRLMDAKIGGRLQMNGAHIANPNGTALMADNLSVAGGMWCAAGFKAEGGVRLLSASIGGELNFNGAVLTSERGPALNADRLKVAQNMFCGEEAAGKPFRSTGEVRLMWASIGGQLVFRGAQLAGIPQTTVRRGRDSSIGGVEVSQVHAARPALNVHGINVTGEMICDNDFRAIEGMNLQHASIGVLNDDKKGWPGSLWLDGLTYRDMSPYMSARERLDWLGRSSEYHGQPYEQLASYYTQLGHDDQARQVLLAKQRARTKQQPWWRRWWGWLQDGMVGYGYAPGRALLLLAAALLLGWIFYGTHHPAPVNPSVHLTFNAAIYTIDLLIPAPVLGDPNDWEPHALALAVALLLRAIGWLLVISVAAAITRAITRS
jgi:hypothetical protein